VAVAIYDPTRAAEEEDDWFGEGSVFDSGEDLAAALLAMAGAGAPAATSAGEPAFVTADLPQAKPRESLLEMLRPFRPGADTVGPAVTPREETAAQPLTWSVRSPGAVSLPPRQPGRTGWSIRSSVLLLQRTEQVMENLREEAVASAFSAAARSLRASD
jgi:hypothetical protein